MAADASIELRGVSKRYGTAVALAGLDLRIEDGAFVSLLGPSGSGKTTTLHILAGLLQADQGRILLGGRDVTDVSPDRRDIAMVFQNYALYPHMTVARNLAFPLRARGRQMGEAEIASRVRDVASMLGIAQLLERYPREISGGQQQRVALGRAMVRDPKVFLLDEPLSNLDARLRLRMRHDLKALHQRLRSTIIYVTHDQSEAMSLSDRIAIYQGGVLQQYAPPVDIYRRPANLFVANFMGEREMNTIEGEIEAGGFLGPKLHLAFSTPDPWAAFADRPVVLGVRPEGVVLGERPGAIACAARIRLVEHAGAEQVFFAEAGGAEFCGKTGPETRLGAGEAVTVSLLPSELYLFDQASGAALVHGGIPVA